VTLTLATSDAPKKWSNSFSRQDIETLTSRAKNRKSFNIFCKMLFGSLENTSTSTLIDILSPYDMELIKSRKMSERNVQNKSFNKEKPQK